jgi:hypothetical protein
MQLVPLNDDSTDGKLTSMASAIQNICNATLSLLFTASLFIWGFLVNRKQAWRTDGGTAAFGIGALMLAIVSTGITFIYIPSKDHYSWMPGLMWAVILWQSFLGWWWWVGSGMGVGEVEEILRREEKRRQKRKARSAARQMRRERAQSFWKSVAGAFNHGRRRRAGTEEASSAKIEPHSGRSAHRKPVEGMSPLASVHVARRTPEPSETEQRSSGSSARTASVALDALKGYPAVQKAYAWYLRLRYAHITASREQAEENVGRIQQVYGREGDGGGGDVDPGVVGWGLGSYGIRQRQDEGERDEGWRGILNVEEEDRHSENSSTVVESVEGKCETEVSSPEVSARRRRNRTRQKDTVARSEGTLPQHLTDDGVQPTSMWYWGPFRRWRLKDSTVYT